MKIQNSIKAAVAAFLIGAAAQASATVVAINATGLPATNYLANGTYQGAFNGTSVLPTNFAINAVGFSFAFADDTDPFTSTTGTPTSSSSDSTVTLNTGDKSVTTTTTITIPVTSTGEKESVQLSFGAITFNGATTAGTPVVTTDTQTGATITGTTTYAKNNGQVCTAADLAQKNSGCKATYYYSVTKTVTNTTSTDYTGNIQLADSLLAYDTLLNQLITNKSLNFSLGVTGDLTLTSASLNVDYTETPEPGTLALFGIALMGVAGLRRARRG
jgi:hypothetical protein